MINTVLFDLDGTLVDSAVPATAALNQTLINAGYSPVSVADVRPLFNAGATALLREFAGVTPPDIEFRTLRDSLLDRYADACRRPPVFPETPEALARIAARGFRWGIVTNECRRIAARIVNNVSWGEHPPEVLVCGDTLTTNKPDPDVLFEAAATLGTNPTNCVYVGDGEGDIKAAHAAGMVAILARYGYLPQYSDTAGWNAEAAIDHPGELMDALGNLSGMYSDHD